MTYRDPLYDASTPETDPLADVEVDIVDQRDLTVDDIDNLGLTGEGAYTQDDTGQEDSGQGGGAMDNAMEKGQEVAGTAMEKGGEALDTAKSRVSEFGGTAQEKADEGLEKASEGLSTAAEMLREQGENQQGQVGDFATMAADRLEGASGYLRERDTDQMLTDLENLVRRKPMESLLVAAGVGLLLSRIVK